MLEQEPRAVDRGHGSPGGRSSGAASSVNIETGRGRVLAEFSFWPLGWVLTFDDPGQERHEDASGARRHDRRKDKRPFPRRALWATTKQRLSQTRPGTRCSEPIPPSV